MSRSLALALSVTCFALAGRAWADQITLTNGDHLTGTILRSDTKTLVLKTDTAGDLTLKWDSIAGISAPGPLYVGLNDNQTIVGAIETADGRFNIATRTAGVVSTSKDAVQFIRNSDEESKVQAEIDHLRNPRLIDLWTGFVDLGFAANRGNANTQTLTMSANAARSTARDKIAVYYTSIFSSSDFSGTTQTTANSKRGGIAYNLNVDSKAFVFGSVDLESDQFQSLDLRFVPAGGAGYHAIATTPTQLDLRLGVSGNREFFSTGLNRTSAEMLLGEAFTRKFTSTTSVEQTFVYFANLSDAGAYRMNFDTSAVTTLRKW